MAQTPWSLGSINLRDGRYQIVTIDGWDEFPPFAGTPFHIPFKHGVWAPSKRYFESKVLALGVVIMPFSTLGTVTHTNGAAAHIRENIDDLMAELYPASGLVTVSRTELNYPGAGTTVWTNDGIVTRAIPVRGGKGTIYRFMFITLDMVSPFWRVGALKTGQTPPTVVNDGNAPVDDMVITFTGGTNPRLTNTTTGEWIEIIDAMATPVVVSVGPRTVTQGGAPADGLLRINPLYPHWMEFRPGSNSLTLTGGGSVSINFYDKVF